MFAHFLHISLLTIPFNLFIIVASHFSAFKYKNEAANVSWIVQYQELIQSQQPLFARHWIQIKTPTISSQYNIYTFNSYWPLVHHLIALVNIKLLFISQSLFWYIFFLAFTSYPAHGFARQNFPSVNSFSRCKLLFVHSYINLFVVRSALFFFFPLERD